MQIYWDTGIRTYSTAQEAQRELKKRGFAVDEPESTEGESTAETRLVEWLGWQQSAGRREKGALWPGEQGKNSRSFREGAPRNQEHGLELYYPG